MESAAFCSFIWHAGHFHGRTSVSDTRSCTLTLTVLCFSVQILTLVLLLLFLPLALQPTVGFGLSNNVLPFFPICHQLSPSSHSQHLKISFCFLFPSFPGSSPSPRPFQFLSEDLFGHPILHSLQVT